MISEFSWLLRHQGRSLSGLLALGMLTGVLMTTVDPIAMKLLIDDGLGQRNLPLFASVIGAVVVMAAVVSGLKLMEGLWTQRIKNRISGQLCQRMLATYYDLPYRQIQSEGEGYFMSRVYEEPRKAVDLTVTLLQQTFTRVVSVIAALGISIYLSWRVTVILAVIVPLLYMLSKKFGSRITRESKLENEAEAEFRKGLGRGLGAYTTTKSFGLRGLVDRSVMGHLDGFFAALYQRVRSTYFFRTASGLSMALAESAVLAAAATDVFLGNMTVGGMLAYMAGFWKLMNGATGLIDQLPEFARARGYIERLREFERDAQPAAPASPVSQIELPALRFGYASGPVISDLDLRIGPGERVLLLGPNGCGKTTLGLILSGYLQAEHQPETHLRLPPPGRVSAMLAPLTFFLGTLRDHLQLDSMETVRRELALAMLRDFQLSDKLDADPASFSEGEKRKAYLVLCLSKPADLYVLDEPLTAVDEGSKDLLIDWIMRCTDGHMLLTVLHGDARFYSRFHRVIELAPRSVPADLAAA